MTVIEQLSVLRNELATLKNKVHPLESQVNILSKNIEILTKENMELKVEVSRLREGNRGGSSSRAATKPDVPPPRLRDQMSATTRRSTTPGVSPKANAKSQETKGQLFQTCVHKSYKSNPVSRPVDGIGMNGSTNPATSTSRASFRAGNEQIRDLNHGRPWSVRERDNVSAKTVMYGTAQTKSTRDTGVKTSTGRDNGLDGLQDRGTMQLTDRAAKNSVPTTLNVVGGYGGEKANTSINPNRDMTHASLKGILNTEGHETEVRNDGLNASDHAYIPPSSMGGKIIDNGAKLNNRSDGPDSSGAKIGSSSNVEVRDSRIGSRGAPIADPNAYDGKTDIDIITGEEKTVMPTTPLKPDLKIGNSYHFYGENGGKQSQKRTVERGQHPGNSSYANSSHARDSIRAADEIIPPVYRNYMTPRRLRKEATTPRGSHEEVSTPRRPYGAVSSVVDPVPFSGKSVDGESGSDYDQQTHMTPRKDDVDAEVSSTNEGNTRGFGSSEHTRGTDQIIDARDRTRVPVLFYVENAASQESKDSRSTARTHSTTDNDELGSTPLNAVEAEWIVEDLDDELPSSPVQQLGGEARIFALDNEMRYLFSMLGSLETSADASQKAKMQESISERLKMVTKEQLDLINSLTGCVTSEKSGTHATSINENAAADTDDRNLDVEDRIDEPCALKMDARVNTESYILNNREYRFYAEVVSDDSGSDEDGMDSGGNTTLTRKVKRLPKKNVTHSPIDLTSPVLHSRIVSPDSSDQEYGEEYSDDESLSSAYSTLIPTEFPEDESDNVSHMDAQSGRLFGGDSGEGIAIGCDEDGGKMGGDIPGFQELQHQIQFLQAMESMMDDEKVGNDLEVDENCGVEIDGSDKMKLKVAISESIMEILQQQIHLINTC